MSSVKTGNYISLCLHPKKAWGSQGKQGREIQYKGLCESAAHKESGSEEKGDSEGNIGSRYYSFPSRAVYTVFSPCSAFELWYPKDLLLLIALSTKSYFYFPKQVCASSFLSYFHRLHQLIFHCKH